MIRLTHMFDVDTRALDGRFMYALPPAEMHAYRAWALEHCRGRYQVQAEPFRIMWRTRDFCFTSRTDAISVQMTKAGWPSLMEFARDLRVFFSDIRRPQPRWVDAELRDIYRYVSFNGIQMREVARTRAKAVEMVRFTKKQATL